MLEVVGNVKCCESSSGDDEQIDNNSALEHTNSDSM